MYLSHKTDYCLNPKDIFFLTLDSTEEGRLCTSTDNGKVAWNLFCALYCYRKLELFIFPCERRKK